MILFNYFVMTLLGMVFLFGSVRTECISLMTKSVATEPDGLPR
jgi:hypothetical protein